MKHLTKKNYIAFLEICFWAVSDECFWAIWLNEIEYDLWDLIQKYNDREDYKFDYGSCVIGGVLVKVLKHISEEIDGWITWDDKKGGSVYIELSEWKKKYKEWEEDEIYNNKGLG